MVPLVARTTQLLLALAAVLHSHGVNAQTAPAAPDSATVAVQKSAFAGAIGFLQDLFDVSTADVGEKLVRIAAIVVIGLIAKLFMDGAKLVSRFLVYSQRGPLKFLFRNHQRSLTLHALVINVLKYVVYFTALGYILSELGINYKTYIASLSVIGIAIGFGSQGLVQDVVTGIFILFENQFMVGDMVEVSGQTGIVEDIGLRTTRIRNYFGAHVVLQNRNIPMAVRYKQGALEVGIDVAIASPDVAQRAAGLLQKAGTELQKQFQEIIMERPDVEGVVELETGETFVRMKSKIWPQQQWVVDAQLVPRIREIFKKEEIEIPGDRVVTFYHFPEADEAPGVVHAIKRMVGYAPDQTAMRDR